MIWADWVLLAVVLLSAVIGLMRGMVREIISLGTWIAALLIARQFGPQVSEMLVPHIEHQTLRAGTGFAITVIFVVMLGSVVAAVGKRFVSVTGLGGFDRITGFMFGAVRGLAILIVLIAVASLTPLREAPWWGNSRFIPVIEDLRDQAAGLVDRQIR